MSNSLAQIASSNGIHLEIKLGEIRIDHRIVADGFGFVNSSKSRSATKWRTNILEKYESNFERIAVLLKRTLDDGTIVWYLTEEQVTLAAGLSRNSVQVVEFMTRVVIAFRDAKVQLAKANAEIARLKAQQSTTEWKEARLGGIPVRNEETDVIKLFVEYAKSQGSQSADKYYMLLTKMMNDTLFEVTEKHKNLRDAMDVLHLGLASVGDRIIKNAVIEGMQQQKPYKEIFQFAKQRVTSLVKVHGKLSIKRVGVLTAGK